MAVSEIDKIVGRYNIGLAHTMTWRNGLARRLETGGSRSQSREVQRMTCNMLNELAQKAAGKQAVVSSSGIFYPFIHGNARIRGKISDGVAWVAKYLAHQGVPDEDLPECVSVRTYGHNYDRAAGSRGSQRIAQASQSMSDTLFPVTTPCRKLQSDPFIRDQTLIAQFGINIASRAASNSGVRIEFDMTPVAIQQFKAAVELPCEIKPPAQDEHASQSDSEFDEPAPASIPDARKVILLRFDSPGGVYPWLRNDGVYVTVDGQSRMVGPKEMEAASASTKAVYGMPLSRVIPRSVDLTATVSRALGATRDQKHIIIEYKPAPGRDLPNPGAFANGILFVETGTLYSPWALGQVISNSPDKSISSNPALSDESECEDDFHQELTRISLDDPLAFTRIKIPGRSVNCRHTQCFDIAVFLEFVRETANFNCPICTQPTAPEDLRVDSFVIYLLGMLPDKDQVLVDRAGRVVNEPVHGRRSRARAGHMSREPPLPIAKKREPDPWPSGVNSGTAEDPWEIE
ncbi:MIZ/SP-RING zinc finger [Carpediemonas membranifera]|uniref:MIZ/SP-RING zinc finger n=1 Tax=Carpediemonas membranifera TaxID=201153 RepID=A0A8J6DXX9_9EUKA|nr:MIZ/SP-RING zinc finger [Carpediemonas membranifera]|eukprot:KAG9391194.1 MIZ/SP-RING zinc finger [Carpediemonas membranifera]